MRTAWIDLACANAGFSTAFALLAVAASPWYLAGAIACAALSAWCVRQSARAKS